MFVIDEKDKQYRFGDSGPKYLMKGPRMNFSIIQFQPGEDYKAHYHNIMEEDFYIMDGEVDIIVDGKVNHLTRGQFIHIEPKEIHYIKNHYTVPVKMVATLAPSMDSDKVEVEDYKY